MRDLRVLMILGLCLLHSVCYGKPLKQSDKRSRVSTKAILKLESQLKDMAGEEDKPTTHRTTPKAPLILPVDETEDSPPPVDIAEEQPEEEGEENQPEINQGEEEEEGARPEESQSEEDKQVPQTEQELFGRFLEMASDHPELLDMSLDEFEALVQRVQEREQEAELNAQADRSVESEDESENALSPEEMRERLQWLQGDANARVVAKKRIIPPVDVLRRRAEAEELRQAAMAKRQPESVDV